MRIVKFRGKDKFFPEITDFPYTKSLSPQALEELKSSLDEDWEKFCRYRQFIAILMSKREKELPKKKRLQSATC